MQARKERKRKKRETKGKRLKETVGEKEAKRYNIWGKGGERKCVCVSAREKKRERDRQSMCLCVCVRDRERVFVCEREEGERKALKMMESP